MPEGKFSSLQRNSHYEKKGLHTMNEEKKLSWKSIIGYGFGEAGTQFSWTLVSSYLTVFYTDVVGLTPVVISAIMLIARIWDAINDPMFGTIAEQHTHTRWGRSKSIQGQPFCFFASVGHWGRRKVKKARCSAVHSSGSAMMKGLPSHRNHSSGNRPGPYRSCQISSTVSPERVLV